MDNTNSKEYWNDYVKYWENKVAEANSKLKFSDKTIDDLSFVNYVAMLKIQDREKILDFGCGTGRLYPYFRKQYENSIYIGADVSGIALEHAQINNKGLEIGRNLYEFDGISLPFKDNYFDKVVCWGVFDACQQEKMLLELFRVAKQNGKILITGKNNMYFDDDDEACVAEINARKKGHPNYFTDIHNLIEQFQKRKVIIEEQRFFLRRGDFVRNVYECKLPDRFYEWLLILRKDKDFDTNMSFEKFSFTYSNVTSQKEVKAVREY